MKCTPRVCLTLVLLLAGAAPARAAGQYHEVSYPPSTKPDELVFGSTYKLWIPDGVTRVRAIIVHQHGCGAGSAKSAETTVEDLHWQALAAKWECALLGPVYHQEDKQNCRLWCDPRNGSRVTFLKSLKDLAGITKHPEIDTAPWCLWGHSGGGFWSSLMQTSDPQRVVAIWFRSGTAFETWEKGEIDKPVLSDAIYQIPMMCNPGAKENGDKRFNGAWTGAMAMFRAYRAKGALIGVAPDPRTAHECGDSRYLAIPFFDACLAARLPDKGSDSEKLKPMDTRQAWLAPLLGDQAKPAADFDGDVKEAVWLPNEHVAKLWSEYVKTGATEDSTPPPAPTKVTAAATADGHVAVAWEAAADFESGIQSFRVQRDGKDLGTVPEKPNARFGHPLYQSMSYHDTPVAPIPAMKYVDSTATDPAGHAYTVTAINSVGLQSAPVKAVARARSATAPAAPKPNPLPKPTYANISYGPHERNVLDVWLAKSDKPTPLLIHIHGGGWLAGDKNGMPATTLKFLLEHEISVASINYRYSTIAPLPAPVHDAARAVQFLRTKAKEWNFDPARFAAMGTSAGACTTLWLAYHDDLADPKSSDPVARESTRLSAGIGLHGQTSIDPEVITGWVGDQVLNHRMISASVGAKNRDEIKPRYAEFRDRYHEFSPINHVDKSDPPVLLVYRSMGPIPSPNQSAAIHHAMLGQKLKNKADAEGAPVVLFLNDSAPAGEAETHKFLLEQLKP